MKGNRRCLIVAVCLLAAFVLWTMTVRFVDVQAIGPQSSAVGLAGINRFVHNLTGVHFGLYIITDWLGLVPLLVCIGFGMLGLVQWIKRKRICKVDFDILALGAFYVIVIAAYLLFERVAINYRPVLINGILEVSYPSSTTMLVMCVIPTAVMQLKHRITNRVFRNVAVFISIGFVAFMVVGRLVSGVHWFTDIAGGALLSAGLVTMYAFVSRS